MYFTNSRTNETLLGKARFHYKRWRKYSLFALLGALELGEAKKLIKQTKKTPSNSLSENKPLFVSTA